MIAPKWEQGIPYCSSSCPYYDNSGEVTYCNLVGSEPVLCGHCHYELIKMTPRLQDARSDFARLRVDLWGLLGKFKDRQLEEEDGWMANDYIGDLEDLIIKHVGHEPLLVGDIEVKSDDGKEG